MHLERIDLSLRRARRGWVKVIAVVCLFWLSFPPLFITSQSIAPIDLRTDADATFVGMRPYDGVTGGGSAGQIAGRLSAIAADVNNDGVSDMIVGVPYSDSRDGNRSNAGAVYVIFGQSGQTVPFVRDLEADRPDVIIYGADPGDQVGSSLAAGDVNGDGFADIIIGAPRADGLNNSKPDVGEVYVIFGGPALLTNPVRDLATPSPPAGAGPNVTIIGWGGPPDSKTGAFYPEYVGYCLAAGDVNGDGIADIVVGAPGVRGPDGKRLGSAILGSVPGGAVYAFWGSRGLASGTVRNVGGTPAGPPSADIVIYGQTVAIVTYKSGEQLGTAVAVGDVNGDRIGDIIAGAPFFSKGMEGAIGVVYVVFGSRTPLSTRDTSHKQPPAGDAPDVILQGIDSGDALGTVIAAGDVNGDGVGEVILGLPLPGPSDDRPQAGEVYVLFGGLALKGTRDLGKQAPELTVYGADAGDGLGFSVTTGDFNGDGIKDLVLVAIGASGPNNQRDGTGEVYVIFGTAGVTAGAVRDLSQTPPDVTIYGANVGDGVGYSVAASDFDKDGKADIIATSPFGDGPPGAQRPKAGVVYIVRGR